ncbi:acyl-CoA dehydrogenase family protein [uncultured Pseudacidovorax sp.]|uniref:acyl-CoA dehydrogenase family protein n=1 Tax=uncultured Pseudacidovorax sp. TaxID=679313 RepID=UPI0025CF43D9|nr:acyl-CoA dehydrogenase family protein [uncultured Pseudacidovorax sp.]
MTLPIPSLPRRVFSEDHEAFREQVRRFVAQEIAPFHRAWEAEGAVPRALWLKAGALGLLCPTVPECWGGVGGDYLHSAVVLEELAYAHAPGPGFAIHSEMAAPYILNFGSDAQKRAWLPRLVSGEAIAGIAMTEPSAGSDLHAIRTRARRDGAGFRLTGQKVFISNGQLADVFIVAAKVEGSDAMSLFLIDAALEGVRRGRKLDKLGHHAQDTSELFFDDVALPETALLGHDGQGFRYLMKGLARERLTICVTCQARAEAVLRETVAYAAQRQVFGSALSELQNTRFVLGAVQADLTAGRALIDRLLQEHADGALDAATAAGAKLWVTEALGRTVDACLQLHGGWGYMNEYAVARAYADARVERIAGGSSEIMKEIVARTLWPRR